MIAAIIVTALLASNFFLVLSRQHTVYTMRMRHLDSMFRVSAALGEQGPKECRDAIQKELESI